MERATNAGKHSVMLTSRKVKTVLVVGAVAISAIALFGRCKPASEENVNKAQVQNSVMGDAAQKPVEKVAPKPDAAETHRAEVMSTTPQSVKEEPLKKVPKIKMVGPGEDVIDFVPRPSNLKGSR